jgi:4'-phosphopantetheinyl transferase
VSAPFEIRLVAIDGREDARRALREALAARLSTEPEAIRIECAPCVHCGEPHGKPYLAEPAGHDLRFNLSHTRGLAVIALAPGREVGVDVEAVRPGRRAQAIADRWFTDAEADAIRSAEDPDAVFFRLWARKEAYLKATAEGFRGGLGSFEALTPELPGWEFHDVDAGPGYAAALALAPPGYSPGG